MSSWTWGKLAYDTFVDSLFHMDDDGEIPTGLSINAFDDLPLNEKEAWAAVAQAVREAAAK